MGQRARSGALDRVTRLRECGGGAPWLVTGHRLSAELLEQTRDVIGRAEQLVDLVDRPDIVEVRSARAALALAWRELAGETAGLCTEPARLAGAIEVLTELRATEDRVRDELLSRQAGATRVVREALAALRDLDTTGELVDRAPAAAATIGFDRVVLSRIDDSRWLPESAFVADDPGWAAEILDAGRADPRILDSSLVETQIVRRHRPLMVSDLAGRPDLHRALVDTSMTRSYVAAPLVGWGRVIGFLHADCYHQRRNPDALDRDLLWTFCEGLGTLVTRASALDGLAALHGELERIASAARDVGGESGWAGVEARQGAGRTPHRRHPLAGCPPSRFSVGPLGPVGPVGPVAAPERELTRRELDVLGLMSGGHTNVQIARRLVIAEGTVKSHVKHILRKLHAANRAEAVSRWLRGEYPGASVRTAYTRPRTSAL